MDGPADLFFAPRLPATLARTATPAATAGGSEPSGELSLEQWLPRYQAMVRLVEGTHTTWAFVASLLHQRGELHGLSAKATASYGRVSELALRHIQALMALADRHPARFRALLVLPHIHQPGVSTDRRVRDAVVGFAQRSVALKLEQSADAAAVYDALLTAAIAAMSYPQLQGTHVQAVDRALTAKLAGSLREETGWAAAGLHAIHGALGLLLGRASQLDHSAPELSRALSPEAPTADLPYPALARLASSAAHYAALIGRGALDGTVANPALFSPERRAALAGLEQALAGLADDGPASPPEKDLLRDTAALADGLVAAIAAVIARSDDSAEATACPSEAGLRGDPDMRDILDRLLKTRRRLLGRPAFERGDSAWLRRLRLVVVVLSDVLDGLNHQGEVSFALEEAVVARALEQALGDWEERGLREGITNLYLLARALIDEGSSDPARLSDYAAGALAALSEAFAPEEGERAAEPTFFSTLSAITADADLGQDARDMGGFLVSCARRAYAQGTAAQGDLLLQAALVVAMMRKQSVPTGAVELARQKQSSALLPLLLHAPSGKDGADPQPVIRAMRKVRQGQCSAPSVDDVAAVRQALYDFRSGRREQARRSLDALLERAEERGLVVPRLTYPYEERAGNKYFQASTSLSLGSHLLQGSDTFQLGLGFRTGDGSAGQPKASFADPAHPLVQQDAARYYAHVAALTAVYHFLDGQPGEAHRDARRAISAWFLGVRLGDVVVPSGEQTAEWAADATGVIALLGQQAAEAGQAFLAGDLWTLLRATLGAQADEQAVGELLAEIPRPLRGIAEVLPLAERARRSLQIVASDLPCVKRAVDTDPYRSSDCRRYPVALGYRVADALPFLPHLRRAAEVGRPDCAPWRALDEFLSAAEAGRYAPDAFVRAVDGLHARGARYDAAALLARQRLPQHCTPVLTKHARQLARDPSLGSHLRADLLSVAANCAASVVDDELIDDLLLLDRLTRRQAVATRNLELLLFATGLGMQADRWRPLVELGKQPDFVARWLGFGPELATTALLIHHAALLLADQPLDPAPTQPYYRLLCTTFPPAERGALCNTIGLLRSSTDAAGKKRAAKDALAALLKQRSAAGQSAPP